MICVARYRGPPLSEVGLPSDRVLLRDQAPAVVLTAVTASETEVGAGPRGRESAAQCGRHGRRAWGSASCLAGVAVESLQYRT